MSDPTLPRAYASRIILISTNNASNCSAIAVLVQKLRDTRLLIAIGIDMHHVRAAWALAAQVTIVSVIARVTKRLDMHWHRMRMSVSWCVAQAGLGKRERRRHKPGGGEL